MDKSIKLAVAGSGKTSHIIGKLTEDDPVLIITYTNNNHQSIIKRIKKKFSSVPSNIDVHTFFNFLYQFCFNPFLSDEISAKGIDWEYPPTHTRYLSRDNLKFYLNSSDKLYYNRISKLILERVDIKSLKDRLEKYYAKMYIDEIQDIGGHDFNLLLELIEADIEIGMVGDFYQHTYSTSNDGNINSNLHDDYESYISVFEEKNIEVDTGLNKSWRCSKNVCQFIRENLGIDIYSHKEKNSTVQFFEDTDEISEIYKDPNMTKLFYRSSNSYKCESKNWGKSKGDNDHEDVCVVLNKKSTKFYRNNKLTELPSLSKNKLYVACSRPHKNLYIFPQEIIKRI